MDKIKRFLSKLILSILIILIFCVCAYFLFSTYSNNDDAYNKKYDDGYSDGYDAGYSDGYDDSNSVNRDEIWDEVFDVYTFWDFIDKYPKFEDAYKAAAYIDYVTEYNIDLDNLDAASIKHLLQSAYQNGYGDGCEYTMDYLDEYNNQYHSAYDDDTENSTESTFDSDTQADVFTISYDDLQSGVYDGQKVYIICQLENVKYSSEGSLSFDVYIADDDNSYIYTDTWTLSPDYVKSHSTLSDVQSGDYFQFGVYVYPGSTIDSKDLFFSKKL